MTILTTPREIRSPQNGRVPTLDSPAVPARAGARVPITQRIGKILAAVKIGFVRWWGWTSRPLSLRNTWARSAVDITRIPNKSGTLRALWHISNWTDRLIMFALIMLAPTAATGALRWLALRPTRRIGLYLTLAALTAAHLLLKGT